MENKHVYIFYGDPRTGKSDLARVIGNCNPAAAYIIDDLTCGKNVINTIEKEIEDKNIKNFIRGPGIYTPFICTMFCQSYVPDNLILIFNRIIVSPDEDYTLYNLLSDLKENKKFKDSVVSVVEFKQGDDFL